MTFEFPSVDNILIVPSDKYMEMYNLDVSDYLDKKGKYSYLAWAWAWVLLKKHFPSFVPTYIPSESGQCYWIDPITNEAYIKPVIIDTETGAFTIPFDFPIMEFKNKTIRAVRIYKFPENGVDQEEKSLNYDLNEETGVITPCFNRMVIEKNVHRAIVKAIAKTTGIGIRLWNDEDVEGDKRAGYLEKLTVLFTKYKSKHGQQHPQANTVFQMTNKELVLLGKELKSELSTDSIEVSVVYPQ